MIESYVLVVSDDEALRYLIGWNLQARGVIVRELPCLSGLASLPPSAPSAIVIDLGEEGEEAGGWAEVQALRGAGGAGQVPLVLLGTLWPAPAQLAALQPLSFVRKPFAVSTLLAALREAQQAHGEH